jgi:hypothetical protein
VNPSRRCTFVNDVGEQCWGFAGKGGVCPPHRKSHGIGGRPSNRQRAHEAKAPDQLRDARAWIAACGCVTGKED